MTQQEKKQSKQSRNLATMKSSVQVQIEYCQQKKNVLMWRYNIRIELIARLKICSPLSFLQAYISPKSF